RRRLVHSLSGHPLLSSALITLRFADTSSKATAEIYGLPNADQVFDRLFPKSVAARAADPLCDVSDVVYGSFSTTNGTLFASHKLPLKGHLAAIAIFCNEVRGKSALAISRDLGLSYKSALVFLHKLREAMAEELKGRVIGGEGKETEVDGAGILVGT